MALNPDFDLYKTPVARKGEQGDVSTPSPVKATPVPVAQKGEMGGFAPTNVPVNPYADLINALGGAKTAGAEMAAEKTGLATAAAQAKSDVEAAKTNMTETVFGPNAGAGPSITETYVDQATGNTIIKMSDGSIRVVPKGGTASSPGKSAYQTIYDRLKPLGLEALAETLKGAISDSVTEAELTRTLEASQAYQNRFSANKTRLAKGLVPLTPAEYIAKEQAYQSIMMEAGLPASYYTRGLYGKQAGFDKLLENDVSAAELKDRIATAQDRVINANPEVIQQLKIYYPDIKNGDILAYALDPANAIKAIKQKVTAAEIGGAAAAAGLSDSAAQAEQLAAYGVTGAQAQQNYGTIAQLAQRGSQLASIYGQNPYGQTQAEQEIFNLGGQTAAQNARKKLTELEKASFAGSSGTSQNALNRDRQMSNYMLGVPGAGAF